MLLYLGMKKQMVELFSGSKNVSNTFEKNGWLAWSVDNNPKLAPSLCCDILELKPEHLPVNVSFIWASPDCSKLSRAANAGNWHKKTIKYIIYDFQPATAAALLSLSLVEATVKIISSFPECGFIIENPIGRIHHLPPLKKLGHYRYAVNYADFGFPYSKETYLFSNLWLPFSIKKVKSAFPGLRTVNGSFERSKVPPALVQKIIDYAL